MRFRTSVLSTVGLTLAGETGDGSMQLSLAMQGVSRTALQWYSKCYFVVSVMETFTLKDAQTIHRSTR
jgi:hypothetical protein